MGNMPTNWLGKSSELKLHCFCLFDAYSMPKNIYSVPIRPLDFMAISLFPEEVGVSIFLQLE